MWRVFVVNFRIYCSYTSYCFQTRNSLTVALVHGRTVLRYKIIQFKLKANRLLTDFASAERQMKIGIVNISHLIFILLLRGVTFSRIQSMCTCSFTTVSWCACVCVQLIHTLWSVIRARARTHTCLAEHEQGYWISLYVLLSNSNPGDSFPAIIISKIHIRLHLFT